MHRSLALKPAVLLTLTTGCRGLPDEVVERSHKNRQGETVTLSLDRYTNDATLSLLTNMPRIQTLTLDEAQATDAGMSHISKLTTL